MSIMNVTAAAPKAVSTASQSGSRYGNVRSREPERPGSLTAVSSARRPSTRNVIVAPRAQPGTESGPATSMMKPAKLPVRRTDDMPQRVLPT